MGFIRINEFFKIFKTIKMKHLLTLLFLLPCLIFGQKGFTIHLENPEPRVGEKVILTFEIDFFDDFIEKNINSEIILSENTFIHGLYTKGIKKEIEFNKVGLNQVGPFEIEFNGKKYVSNSIHVNVIPKITSEEGIQFRIAQMEGQKYLIVEQLQKTTKNNNSKNDFQAIEIRPELGEFINLSEAYSSVETSSILNSSFNFSYTRYKIDFDENFEGEYVLSEKDFLYWPKKEKFKPFSIGNQ
ncbi:MAG: hypothetical protein C4K58_06470 [Flavobacteriaceae bacterium]|nr:MAG: hypothetical protein C4K58_06470 [Flavobacteriaceae bacterium]